MSFIQEIAKYLTETYKEEPVSVFVLFPNRRPADYLIKALHDKGNVCQAPHIYSIDDFIQKALPYAKTNNFHLIAILYHIFRKHLLGKENYDLFYSWGEMLLLDFSEIDKHLVKTNDLFSVLLKEKEITQRFYYLDEEQIQAIKQFWAAFHPERISDEQKSFLHLWKELGNIYTDFQAILEEKHIAYTGMLYRKLAEKPELYLPTILPPSAHLIIAGFNTLTPSEVQLFSHLKKTYQTRFFWDVDKLYTENPDYEAGYYYRKYKDKFVSVNKALQGEKEVYLYDITKSVSQFQRISTLINGKVPESGSKQKEKPIIQPQDSIAIILPDDSKLQPLLSSISPIIGEHTTDRLNITMGLQLLHSLPATLFEGICEMHRFAVKEGDDYKYSRKRFFQFINHPLLAPFAQGRDRWKKDIETEKILWIYLKNLPYEWKDITNLLYPLHDGIEFLKQLNSFFAHLIVYIKDTAHTYIDEIQKELTSTFSQAIRDLITAAEEENIPLSIDISIRLVRQLIRNTRVPFQSDSTNRIQIMGLIESQCLDFNHVFITDCNEDILPPSSSSHSYIPYSIRRAFGLTTPETHHRMYSYYFYRLLNRSQTTHLFYNTLASDLQPGEPSRYIQQIRADLPKDRLFEFKENKVTSVELPKPIAIGKSTEILNQLRKYTTNVENGTYLTPSAINTYLDCRLKFYFRYIAGLQEDTNAEEDINLAVFGNLLHQTMQYIYETGALKNKSSDFSETQINALHTDIDHCINRAFHKIIVGEDSLYPYEFQGSELIVYNILKEYIRKILDYDVKHAPLTILKMEEKDVMNFNLNEITVRIGGKIDRLDKVGQAIRVIDYKTGSSEKKKEFKLVSDLFEIHAKKRANYALQVLLYAYITGHFYDDNMPIMPVLMFIRDIQRSDFDIRLRQDTAIINDSRIYFEEIEKGLKNCMEDLFNPNIAFDQTPHNVHCGYCPYTMICRRSKVED
ncbi:MAG: PD-(D/E)XK nuclease family protein [Flavobacteriales bacterium]|nr:PD-(D/E)XK nuclease family protein [Flavobacteriales bacterium]